VHPFHFLLIKPTKLAHSILTKTFFFIYIMGSFNRMKWLRLNANFYGLFTDFLQRLCRLLPTFLEFTDFYRLFSSLQTFTDFSRVYRLLIQTFLEFTDFYRLFSSLQTFTDFSRVYRLLATFIEFFDF